MVTDYRFFALRDYLYGDILLNNCFFAIIQGIDRLSNFLPTMCIELPILMGIGYHIDESHSILNDCLLQDFDYQHSPYKQIDNDY